MGQLSEIGYNNGTIFFNLFFNSMTSYIKLVGIWVVVLLYLTLKPEFGWGNYLSLTRNELQCAGVCLMKQFITSGGGYTGLHVSTPCPLSLSGA